MLNKYPEVESWLSVQPGWWIESRNAQRLLHTTSCINYQRGTSLLLDNISRGLVLQVQARGCMLCGTDILIEPVKALEMLSQHIQHVVAEPLGIGISMAPELRKAVSVLTGVEFAALTRDMDASLREVEAIQDQWVRSDEALDLLTLRRKQYLSKHLGPRVVTAAALFDMRSYASWLAPERERWLETPNMVYRCNPEFEFLDILMARVLERFKVAPGLYHLPSVAHELGIRGQEGVDWAIGNWSPDTVKHASVLMNETMNVREALELVGLIEDQQTTR